MKKAKRILCMVLAAVLLLALCACGGTTTPTSAPATEAPAAETAAPETAAPETEEPEPEPEDSGEVYTFTLSVADPQGSMQDEYFVTPFKELLAEKSGGRIELEVYYGSSLAGQGATLDAIKNGLVDMGQDVCAMYPGQFLYNELLGTPGFDFGGYENFSRIANEFAEEFYDEAMDPFVKICQFAFGDFGICTTNTPVTTTDDVNGLMVRTSSQVIPWYEAMKASATFLPMSDVYESLRLNVINAVHTSIGTLYAFKVAEVTDYYTPLPMHCGDSIFAMSREVYDSVPADIQKALDETFAEMLDVGLNFAAKTTEITMESCKEMNPNFEFLELEDAAGFVEAAQPLVQAKVEELNAAGLDGDGAYAWLMERTVK